MYKAIAQHDFVLYLTVCTFPQMRYFTSDLGLPVCSTLEGNTLEAHFFGQQGSFIVLPFRFGMHGVPLLLQHIREDDGCGRDRMPEVLHHRRVLRGDKGILGCQLSLKVRIKDTVFSCET